MVSGIVAVAQPPAINFSVQHVTEGRSVTIKDYEQMTIHGIITIEGFLLNEGELVLEE